MQDSRGIPLIQTKMMIPSVREHLVHRNGLINKIEKGIKQGFILVSAPPGYGKTTLVADWAQRCSTPLAWLTLDEHDNDAAYLARYLNLFLEKFFDLRTEGSHVAQVEDFHVLLVELINACAGAAADFTCVLDDYHVIQNPQIQESMMFLLDHFPAHLRLILVTRSDPPFSLARLRANNRILELHAADLAFSIKEAEQFLNQTKHLHLTDESVRQFYQKTEGWITGLQLASLAQSEAALIQPPGLSLSSNANLTLEYMVDEVLSRQPAEIQEFLLRTSVLENLSGPLCDAVLNRAGKQPDGRELLHTLYHSNLFLSILDADEHWFRYHALFAEALRHLLTEKYPEEIPGLYGRASEWCDQNGLFEEALTYARGMKNTQRSVTLMEKYAIRALTSGRLLDIGDRVRRVDEQILSASPVLAFISAWSYLSSFDLEACEWWLEKALSLLAAAAPDSHGEYHPKELWGDITATQSLLAALHGDHHRAIEFSQQALNYLPAGSYSHSFVLLNRGLSLSLHGELDQAVQTFLETISISQKAGNWVALTVARSSLGEIWIEQGKLGQAMALFQQSIKFISTSNNRLTDLEGFLHKQMGRIFFLRNQLSEAEQNYLFESPSKEWLSSLSSLDAHLRLAQVYHSQGNYKRSVEEVALARQISSENQARVDDLVVDLLEVKLSLYRGQTALAQRWIQRMNLGEHPGEQNLQGIPFSFVMDIQMVYARYNLALARANGDTAKYTLAVDLLQQVLPKLEEAHLVEHQIEAWILMAQVDHERNQIEEMARALKTAFRLAEPEEYRQIFLDEGIVMARLLTHYLAHLRQSKSEEETSTRAYVADLLFRLTGKETGGDKPGPEVVAAEDRMTVELLTARETEVLALAARGRSNSEIALDLHISVNTVKRHLNNVFMKLGVSTRVQAIRVGHQQGLI